MTQSANDILRKYLDILGEETTSAAPTDSQMTNPGTTGQQSMSNPGITLEPHQILPPKEGAGSILAVSQTLKAFQEHAGGLKATGLPDPETLQKLKELADKPEAQAVKKAVTEYQQTKQLPVKTGEFDPRTFAEMLSDSGKLDAKEEQKLQSGWQQAQAKAGDTVNESVGGVDARTALEHKAALHEGYAQGLKGAECACMHEVGTPHHSHHSHGYMLGKKEYDECWNPNAGVAM